MFKGKKGVFILISLNIVIWSFFVYRFYALYHESDAEISANVTPSLKLEVSKDSIMYELKLNYEDPFLKAEPKETRKPGKGANFKVNNPVTKLVAPKRVTVVPQIQRPDIKYLGLVKNSTNGIATAIVSINGQSKLIKPNETVDGILFKNFDNSELNAVWGKEKIVVAK